jgi:hypothetical protein
MWISEKSNNEKHPLEMVESAMGGELRGQRRLAGCICSQRPVW